MENTEVRGKNTLEYKEKRPRALLTTKPLRKLSLAQPTCFFFVHMCFTARLSPLRFVSVTMTPLLMDTLSLGSPWMAHI